MGRVRGAPAVGWGEAQIVQRNVNQPPNDWTVQGGTTLAPVEPLQASPRAQNHPPTSTAPVFGARSRPRRRWKREARIKRTEDHRRALAAPPATPAVES